MARATARLGDRGILLLGDHVLGEALEDRVGRFLPPGGAPARQDVPA
jgi:hypothetical protein